MRPPRILTIVPLVLAALVLSPAIADEGANLLQNPGFEQGDLGQFPPGWIEWTRNPSTFVTSDAGREGGRCAKLVFQPNEQCNFVLADQPVNVSLTEGEQYRARCWVRADTPTPLTLWFYGGSVKVGDTPGFEVAARGDVTAKGDWTEVTAVLDIPDVTGRQGLYLRFALGLGGAPGATVHVDDTEIVRMRRGLAWLPPAMSASTGAADGKSSVAFYLSLDGAVDAQIGAHPDATVHLDAEGERTAAGQIGAEPKATAQARGPAQFEQGKRGQALLAGDGKAYLSFDAANLPAKEGTLEFWIKPLDWDAIATDTFHVWVETPADDQGNWFVFYKYYNDQTVRFIREKGQSLVERKCFRWTDWIHLAVTWSPEGQTIYWNGTPSGTRKPVNPPDSYPGRMMVGDRAWGEMARKDEHTLIDELYIYDRALEPEEITWAYRNADSRTPGADLPRGLVPTKVHAKILPSQGRIVAEVLHQFGGDFLKSITGTAELIGPTPISPAPLTIGEHDAEAVLPFEKLVPGDYKLRVQFKDSTGQVVNEVVDKFLCPANEWLGNKIGMSDAPPAPFTPLEASAGGFTCLLREFVFDRSGLPRQITSAGADLLSTPVSLRASFAGRKVTWQCGAVGLTGKSDVAAEYAGQWRGSIAPGKAVSQYVGPGGASDQLKTPVLQMDWTSLVEYDGMIKYSLTMTATAKDVEIDRLELRFPVRGEFATLINSSASVGAIPAGEGPAIEASTANSWWVGNEDRGLLAFCESDEAWDRVDRADGFRVERNGEAVEVVWSFIGTPVKIEKPWTFTFGMTATPVKDTKGLSGRPSRIMYSNPWLMDTPLNYRDDGLAAAIENEGLRDKIWSNFHVLWLGSVWTQYKLDWRTRPSALDFMPAGINRLKAKGLSPIQYFLPREVTESVPEWRFWSAEWTGNQKITWTNEVWDSTTCTQSWIDFIVWYMVGNMERYGFSGFYIDNAVPAPVINPDVPGAGYLRDGVVRPTAPWFAMRQIMKRLYTAAKERGAKMNEPTMIMAHMSGALPVAYLGFMDNRLDGEQFQYHFRHKGMIPQDVISLDRWRAQLLAANVGNMPVMISYKPMRNRGFMSLLLLHDVGIWFSGSPDEKAVHDMWTLQDDFGVQDAEFLPYWKTQAIISGQTDAVKVTAYRKPDGGALLIVANLSKEKQNITLEVDWEKLKSPGQLTVTDAETGEDLALNGNALSIEVPALDYRAVRSR